MTECKRTTNYTESFFSLFYPSYVKKVRSKVEPYWVFFNRPNAKLHYFAETTYPDFRTAKRYPAPYFSGKVISAQFHP